MCDMKAKQKVADFLMLMSMENMSSSYSSSALKFSVLHINIAYYLGLDVDTVGRILEYFPNEGIVIIERHQVSIEDFETIR